MLHILEFFWWRILLWTAFFGYMFYTGGRWTHLDKPRRVAISIGFGLLFAACGVLINLAMSGYFNK